VEAPIEAAAVLENTQQQVGHERGNDLNRQSILAQAERLFDFINLFQPFPPGFDRPPCFI
jgi:hypothetical protein